MYARKTIENINYLAYELTRRIKHIFKDIQFNNNLIINSINNVQGNSVFFEMEQYRFGNLSFNLAIHKKNGSVSIYENNRKTYLNRILELDKLSLLLCHRIYDIVESKEFEARRRQKSLGQSTRSRVEEIDSSDEEIG